eukprot:2745476-Pleurochrysis_carterae.AAC.1
MENSSHNVESDRFLELLVRGLWIPYEAWTPVFVPIYFINYARDHGGSARTRKLPAAKGA